MRDPLASTIAKARALYVHRFLFRLAMSAGNLFAWICVFRVFLAVNHSIPHSLAGAAALYAVSQALTIFLTPLTGASLRFGIKRKLAYAVVSVATGFILVATLFVPLDGSYAHLFPALATFAVLSGMYRALYWIPYASMRAESGATRSPFVFARESAVAAMPVLAGLIMALGASGAVWLFLGLAALALASLIPIVAMEESHERYDWGYAETFKRLTAAPHRAELKLAVCDGVQGAALLIIWPLAVFIVLGFSFPLLGAVLSISLIAAFALRRIVRYLLRATRADRSAPVVAGIAFTAWVARIAAGSPFQVVAADVYYYSGVTSGRIGVDPHSYEQAADLGHFVDEKSALKEIGQAAGRIAIVVVFGAMALFVAESVAFIVALVLAGCAAAASIMIARKIPHEF